jgi:hypothetical protein
LKKSPTLSVGLFLLEPIANQNKRRPKVRMLEINISSKLL